ncbi:hypothetical protein HanRHA438_Chr10g0466021 [Helianthus annuus]|uniref:Uncharacterized protein n=1 Tax=Helianthus annuus TaxID=4232 RepID=A0A251TM58_HELAN|nr:hypothetical protein HanXRQr2_Chr10g0453201 [Helianthus annuus]KAJ0880686.1 hypothetical protein HanRHA438_Chr10g0466021 [Helianthus annuus]
MNSLKPQGLFLANHFDDVDILLIKIIHLWAPNSILFVIFTCAHSLSNQKP